MPSMQIPVASSIACIGACCSTISISVDADAFERGEGNRDPDLPYMRDMLRESAGDNVEVNAERHQRYTCRYFDGLRCTAYESRPAMCARYPDEGVCEWCTFDPAVPERAVRLRETGWILYYHNCSQALETGIFPPYIVDVITRYA